jgi:hypothetical protein
MLAFEYGVCPNVSLFQLALDPPYIASGRTQQKTPFPNNSSIVIEVCLPRHCIEMAVLLLLRARSFPLRRAIA